MRFARNVRTNKIAESNRNLIVGHILAHINANVNRLRLCKIIGLSHNDKATSQTFVKWLVFILGREAVLGEHNKYTQTEPTKRNSNTVQSSSSLPSLVLMYRAPCSHPWISVQVFLRLLLKVSYPGVSIGVQLAIVRPPYELRLPEQRPAEACGVCSGRSGTVLVQFVG